MPMLGYKLMSEEHGPRGLVENARAAEQAGFDFAAISDHFSPWVRDQGHAPLIWPVLGAVAQATDRLGLMTAVTCPSFRYHPAILAQGAATLAVLSEERFTLGLGSGERLNEHVVGGGWPGLGERHERLSEALDIIQGLLSGDLRNYRGTHFEIDNARLWDLPKHKPNVILAAAGPDAGRMAGEKAEGVIATGPDRDVLNGYAAGGGTGPRYAEIAMCCAPDEAAARETVHRYFRWSATGWPVQAELPDTAGFEAASQHVTPEALAEGISCGPSAETHLTAIQDYIEAGYDHLILVQIGPNQDYFFEMFERELAPALRQG